MRFSRNILALLLITVFFGFLVAHLSQTQAQQDVSFLIAEGGGDGSDGGGGDGGGGAGDGAGDGGDGGADGGNDGGNGVPPTTILKNLYLKNVAKNEELPPPPPQVPVDKYDFGNAYFSATPCTTPVTVAPCGLFTHYPQHLGPHIGVDFSLSLGQPPAQASGQFIPAVDEEGKAHDDDSDIDYDGLDVSTSTRTQLNVSVYNYGDPGSANATLGTLIVSRFENIADPHVYDFKVLEVFQVSFPQSQVPITDPQAFVKEGWLRLLYFQDSGMTPQLKQDILNNWDGTHQSLSSILGQDLEEFVGEIEDYPYREDCTGFSFFKPGRVPFQPASASCNGQGGMCDVDVNLFQNIYCPGGTGNPGNPGPPPPPFAAPTLQQVQTLLQTYQSSPSTPQSRLDLMYNFLLAVFAQM